MREDIKDLLETRPLWQETHNELLNDEFNPPPVKEAVADWRKQDPVMVDLFAHWIKSHREDNQQEVEIAKQAIEEHKKENQ